MLVCRYKFSHLPMCHAHAVHSALAQRRILACKRTHTFCLILKSERINHRKSNRHTFYLVLDRFSTSSSPSSPVFTAVRRCWVSFSIFLFGFFTQIAWIRFADFSHAVSHALLLLFPLIHAAECVLVTMRSHCFCYERMNVYLYIYILLNERCDDDDKTIWWRHHWQQ